MYVNMKFSDLFEIILMPCMKWKTDAIVFFSTSLKSSHFRN